MTAVSYAVVAGVRSPLAMRFEFYTDALENTPKLSVDGTVPNSVHFSHWEGNETPSELKADTSTEITLNLVASPRCDEYKQGIDVVTNNPFDSLLVFIAPRRGDEIQARNRRDCK